jgi:outer membrane receptor for ferrienterochelin and colicin
MSKLSPCCFSGTWLKFASSAIFFPCCIVTAATSSTPDLFKLSLEELTQVNVTVASLFDSTELDAKSTVAVVDEHDWRRRGARRTLDAISHLPETMVLPVNGGLDVIAIRGYAQTDPAHDSRTP